jgi:hypothetical protein
MRRVFRVRHRGQVQLIGRVGVMAGDMLVRASEERVKAR